MKRIVDFAISNAFTVIILAAVFAAIAIIGVAKLNIEAFPDPAPPIFEIVTTYDGRSSEEVEKQVTIPVETALAGMPGLITVNSVSLYGLSDIKCKFTYDSTYKDTRQEVLNRLTQVTLPPSVTPNLVANSLGEIMRYRVQGNKSLTELRTIQDWIVTRYLKTVEGVEDVNTYGGKIKTYEVTVDPAKLQKYKLPLADIIDSLSKSNANVGGRVLEFGSQYYTIRGIGLLRGIDDIQNSFVAMRDGKPILLKDIANVMIGNVPRTGIVGLNGDNDIVMGTVVLRKNAQSLPSMKALHVKIDELNNGILPKGVKVVPFYDRQDLLDTVIGKIKETAALGMFLVFAIILVFLGEYRSALIVASVIPLSLLFTLATMSFGGSSANLISLGAIDFGIIVDIPLLVVENYFRLKHQKKPHMKCLAQTSDEIGKPIIFSAFIIFLAFIPLFTMEGSESQIFTPMAKTYIYAISFALILTFTYLFAFSSRMLEFSHEHEFSIFIKMRVVYLRLLEKITPKKALFTTFTVLIAGAGLAITLGMEFLPKMDEGNIYMRATLPYSISLSKSYTEAIAMKNSLREFPEIDKVEFQAGRPEDGTDPSGPYNTEFFVGLKPYSSWPSGLTKEDLENEIRKKLDKQFPNADISLSQYIEDNLEEAMSGVKGENSVKIFGDDLFTLNKFAKTTQDNISSVKGITDVGVFKEIGQPNLIIEVNREHAAQYGLNVEDIMDVVSSTLDGKVITSIIEGDKQFDMVLRFPDDYRKSVDQIKEIPIVLQNGGTIALSEVTNIHYDTGASFIYRENFKRYVPIKFSVVSDDLAGTVAKAQEKMATMSLPDGYFVKYSGIFQQMKEAFDRLKVTTTGALFLIFLFLFIYYGSIRNTLIVLSAPIFSVFGGILSLVVTGEALSVSAIVGFISILGVSVLNSSILLSSFLHNMRNGLNRMESIKESANEKFRAILMTGLTASIGLLPAALNTGVGSQVQKPLAIVVVGGMLIGTSILLFILPKMLYFADAGLEESTNIS
jgi:cobalt-zinc-cadmium resistance protein CzcA